jgi:hypothetical protein
VGLIIYLRTKLGDALIRSNPQYTKNQSFYIDSERAVQVMPKTDDITKKRSIPTDALGWATTDSQGSIRVHPTPDIFERMYLLLLEYHFSKISFLEMLAKWEEVLGIRPPQTKSQNIPDEGNGNMK